MAYSTYWKFISRGNLRQILTKIFDTTVGHNHDGSNSRGIAFPGAYALLDGRIIVGSAGNVGAAVAMSGDTTVVNTGAVTIGAKKVTKAKMMVYISAERTATGAAETIAHGLTGTPANVIVVPTDLNVATVGDFTVTEGVHDGTNVYVTVTLNKKYKVLALV